MTVGVTVRGEKNKKRVAMNGYMIVAIDGDRLYLTSAPEKTGYKVSESGSVSMHSWTVKISSRELYEWALTHSGDYDLEYDEELRYWYVDTSY